MIRHAFTMVGMLAFVATASGQPEAPVENAGEPKATGSYTVHLQPAQLFERVPGSTLTILGCTQDEQGFIWLGLSAHGLSRWDGYQYREYRRDPENPNAMRSSFVTDLRAGPGNKLWIATGDAGLSMLDLETDKFTHYQANPDDDTSLSTNGINLVYIDSKENLWAGGSDGVLNKFNPADGTFQHVRDFQELEVELKALVEDETGTLWVGTDTEGLFKFDPAKNHIVDRYVAEDGDNSITNDSITALLIDKDAMWIGTQQGLNRLDRKTGKFTRFMHEPNDRTTLDSNKVHKLLLDRDGVLWVGTEGGVNELMPNGKFIQYSRDAKDSATTANFPRYVSCALEDRGGVIYFSDPTVGFFKTTPSRRRFQPYVYASRLTEIGSTLTPEAEGVFWGGTFGQGVVRYDFNKREVTAYPILGDPNSDDSILLEDWVMAVHLDKRGHLWLGGRGFGIIDFDVEANTVTKYVHDDERLDGPTHNDVQDIIEGADGSIWVATFGGGLNRFYPKTKAFMDFMTEPDDPATISSNFLYVLELDRKDPNIMWIGTARGGLNRFNINKEKFTRYKMSPEGAKSQDYDLVMALHQMEDGTLWLGTDGGGLIHFDPQTTEKRYFGAADGLPSNVIYGILPGGRDDLWLSTNGGGLTRMLLDASGKPTFEVYTEADGLYQDVFNQNAALRMPDGKLVFVGGNAMHYFDPKKVTRDDFKPNVALTSFKLYNKEVALEQPIWTNPSIHLDYDQDIVMFEFAGLSYASPNANMYQYKMDGLHDWIETNRRFAIYTDIDGGDYTFRVRAANQSGVWSDQETTLSVRVDAPPWLRWWAFAIYALILFIIIVSYLRYNARKVERLRDQHRLETVEQELELTGAVQTGFLPKSNSVATPAFNLEGYYRPADRASGDWWWYEQVGDTFNLLIGDVTGHGPGPAMVTAAAATAFRIQGRDHQVSMRDRLHVLNEEVLRVGGGNYQMTMTAIEIDGRSGRFIFYSAGGQPIMRLRNEGKPRLLPCPGTPLGTEAFNLGRVEGTMVPNERLLLYTDGIPELELAKGRLLGMRRFSMICERTRGLPLQGAVNQIVEAADVLRNNGPQDDDWTFAMIEWKGGY